VERRKHQRIACILDARLENGEEKHFHPEELARVLNISRGGLSMHSATPFPVGTQLTMRVRRGDLRMGPLQVAVRHVTEQPNGTWIMGGEFTAELENEAVEFLTE
jgi:PilZ domain